MSDLTQKDDPPDLPVSNPVEAAKLLAGMRDFDPLTALNDLSAWLDAVKGIPRDHEKDRGEILSLIQEAGDAHVSAQLARFMAQPKGKQEDWDTLDDYARGLAGALCTSARILLKLSATTPSLQLPGAAGAARGLHASRMLAKAHFLRYLSVPPKLWQLAYAVHGDAEKAGCATTPVHMHAAHKTTTVAQELLRMLMLQSSSPEMMRPEHIEVADRVLEQLGDFTLRPRGVADNPFCFDPASDTPPHRAPGERPDPNAEFRYFGAGAGYDALDRLYHQSVATKTPMIKASGKDIPHHVQISAIKHLLVFWGLASPYSPPARTPATGNLQVIHGYGQIWQHLSSHVQSGATELTLVEYGDGAAQAAPETWAQHDAGGNELGAEIPQRSSGWARCGELVSVTMPGSNECWLAMIRSMHAGPGRGLHVNIFVLSHQPQAVQLRPVIAKDEANIVSENAARQFDFKGVRAIIVSDGAGGSQTANFMLPPDSWEEGRVYEATIGGAARFLRSLQLLRHGDDYVRATFEWVQQA